MVLLLLLVVEGTLEFHCGRGTGYGSLEVNLLLGIASHLVVSLKERVQ